MAEENVFAETFVDIASGKDLENIPKEKIGSEDSGDDEEVIASAEPEEEESEEEESEEEESEEEESEEEESEGEESEEEESEEEESEEEGSEEEESEEEPQPTSAGFTPFKLNNEEFKNPQDIIKYIEKFREEYPEADTAMQLYLREMMKVMDEQGQALQKFTATQTRTEVMQAHPDLNEIEKDVLKWAKAQPGQLGKACLDTLVKGTSKEINKLITMYKNDTKKSTKAAKKSSSRKPVKEVNADKVRVLQRKGTKTTTKAKAGGGTTASFADYFREAAK